MECRTRRRKDETTYRICYKPEEARPVGTPRRARIPEGIPPPRRVPEGIPPPRALAETTLLNLAAIKSTSEIDLIGRDVSLNLDRIFSTPNQSNFALAASGQISLGELNFPKSSSEKNVRKISRMMTKAEIKETEREAGERYRAQLARKEKKKKRDKKK